MKTRVVIEYDLPAGDRVVVRDQEEQRWTKMRNCARPAWLGNG
jgi:hypothetical protein